MLLHICFINFNPIAMKTYPYFVGIDVSAETFYASIYISSNRKYISEEFSNSFPGFDEFLAWLQAKKVSKDAVLVCMEATGVYCERLCYFLASQGLDLVVEAPHKVKRAFHKLTKTDKVDSQQIAEYACRFTDALSLWEPKNDILEKLRSLLTTRENLVSQRTANQNALTSMKRKVVQSYVALNALESVNETLLQQIKEVEKEIENLIKSDDDFHHLYRLVTTIPAVKLLFFANLLVLTNGFAKENTPRQTASYLGIAPHEHTSGTSVRRRTCSTGHGNYIARKLMYLAALSLRTHNEQMRTYYERKKLEGKPPRLILNNMSNKLIKMIYAIVRDKKQFMKNYVSVPPIVYKTV